MTSRFTLCFTTMTALHGTGKLAGSPLGIVVRLAPSS